MRSSLRFMSLLLVIGASVALGYALESLPPQSGSGEWRRRAFVPKRYLYPNGQPASGSEPGQFG